MGTFVGTGGDESARAEDSKRQSHGVSRMRRGGVRERIAATAQDRVPAD